MDKRVTSIKEIRAKLGCDLREAADLYDNHKNDWEAHVAAILVSKRPWNSPMEQVRDQIRGYHNALTNGEPEEAAMRKAFSKIQQVLGMFWTPPGNAAMCKHCSSVIHQRDGHWYSNKEPCMPQYCWVDPVHGSQLHEPNQ